MKPGRKAAINFLVKHGALAPPTAADEARIQAAEEKRARKITARVMKRLASKV